jgi:hypothetical protein
MAETTKTGVPLATEQGGVSVTTTTTTAQAPNPEALEDVPRAQPAAAEQRFQNVDLEAGTVPTTSPPTNPTATTTTSPLEKSVLTEFANNIDWGTANLLLAFSAFVVMVSAATICGGSSPFTGRTSCSGIPGYQVACGTISGFFALLFGTLYHFGKFEDRRQQEFVSGFQFLWWVAGTIVLTFFGDFTTTTYANGYFGTWFAFLFATVMLMSVSPIFQHTVDKAAHSIRKPLLFLVVASAVEMGASIGPCSPSTQCKGYNGFAVSLGSISLGISLILLFIGPKIPNRVMRFIAIFMVLWWVIGFGVVTFGAPFLSTGNGYFASLAAVFASVAFLQMVNSQA